MIAKSKRLVSLLALIAAGWIALFYSAKGLLVWQWTDDDAHKLSCWYATATGPEKRSHLHTVSGILGRSECPRTIDVR